MIELINGELKRLLTTYNLSHDSQLIIAKEYLNTGDSIATLTEFDVDNFEDIIVFSAEDFYYCDDASQLYTYGRLSTSEGIEYHGDHLSIGPGVLVPREFVVVYSLYSTNAANILEGINLISVDYVGSNIKHIKFGGTYNYLTEINLSGNTNLGLGVLENLSLNDTQTLNYGNYNIIDFTGTPFAGSPIKKFVFPETDNTYTIPAGFFAGCTDLEEVYIPDEVTAIGANAFKGCSNLKYIHIGSRVATIGDGAFDGCTYPTLNFDVSYDNTEYFGEVGALIKGPLEFFTMELVHATNAWFDYTLDSGISNCHVVKGDTQSLNTGFNINILVGMYTDAVQGGTETVVDVNGNTIHNLTKITGPGNLLDNLRTQFPNGALNSHFYIPMYQIIYSIGSDACVGDTNIQFTIFKVTNGSYNWHMLRYIGDRAFKGCTNLSSVNLPGYCNQYYDSAFEDLFIGASAFEGCTILSSIQFYKYTALKTKSFFGCTNLHHIQCDYPPIFETNSSLWFGNTPSLESITAASLQQDGNVVYYNGQPANAIVNDAKDTIIVGCKNTDFSAVHSKYSTVNKIGDYAFYGCTDLTIGTDISSTYPTVGDSAFYNCTSIYNTSLSGQFGIYFQYIGANAFYGCTGIEYMSFNTLISLGSKAFGNTSISYVTLPSSLTTMADDAFDNCPLIYIVANEGNNSALRSSTLNTENALLKRIDTNSTQVSLIKSGEGQAIVNTQYVAKPIIEIKSKAFSGVNLNSGTYSSNYDIHVPSAVEYLGSNIFTGSALSNNESIIGYLYLDGNSSNITNVIVNDPNTPSIGLMYLIGAKYFKKIVEDTYQNRLQHKIYYNVEYNGQYLLITECIDGGVINLLGVIDNTGGDIILHIERVPDCQYASGDFGSHAIHQFDLTLMRGGQILTPEEQMVYFDPGDGNPLVPGTMWCDILIPNDICYTEVNTMNSYYNPRGNAFADCRWIRGVYPGKKLSNMKGVFKNCTRLEGIQPTSYEVIHDFSNPYGIFDGIVPESAFEGCDRLLSIDQPHPIKYEKNAFKGCFNLEHRRYLTIGTSFKSGSFANTEMGSIELNSPTFIDPQAFIGNNLIEATADNSCGYYFTGCGSCIVNSENKIIVGALGYDMTNCQGIGPYAFYGRTYNTEWMINISGKNGFTIGESAFAESNIGKYMEESSSNSVIGKNAFSKCTNLTTVMIKDSATLGQGAFSDCTSLSALTLPSNIVISKYAFMNCETLDNVQIGNTVSQYAFSGCINLQELYLDYDSSSSAIIQPSAFIKCPISDIAIMNATTTNNYIFNKGGIYKYNSDNYLELVIGAKNINNPEQVPGGWLMPVKVIGEHAFNGRGLTDVFTIPANITKIGDYAFANNPGITRVVIPPTVEYIGAHAFDGCRHLESFTIPDSCTYVGAGAFSGCALTKGVNCNTYDERYYSTSSVQLSKTDIVNTKFDGSLDLTNTKCFNAIVEDGFCDTKIRVVKLPLTVSVIEQTAFKNCQLLTEVHFPKGQGVSIQEGAFYGCTNLCNIYLYDADYAPNLNSNIAFYDVGTSQTIKQLHLPSSGISLSIEQSDFYQTLVNTCGFTTVFDLDI